MTIGQLIEKLRGFDDPDLPVWLFNHESGNHANDCTEVEAHEFDFGTGSEEKGVLLS